MITRSSKQPAKHPSDGHACVELYIWADTNDDLEQAARLLEDKGWTWWIIGKQGDEPCAVFHKDQA